ncbi:S6A13-like protein [Mya arenaria]|uniref:Transporter n=1 Tax=Mya arenaria TaxID=6604 RepID=A0ABY7DWL0_MYAAR|nr:S6A13-like protein [Mya arenaria]
MGKEKKSPKIELDGDQPPDTELDYKKRETWGSRFDFLLACIGFSVGLGNVWRFPYLCYKNGGGAFLIPYLICVIVGGIPLFYLEVAVGQFMGVAGINAWNLCPIFRGIGLSTLIIVFFLNCYYNVILAWAFRYFFASFTSKLPWTDCDPDWATEHCSKFDPASDNRCNYTHANNVIETGAKFNGSCISKTDADTRNITVYLSAAYNATEEAIGYKVEPVTEYWENKVLAISDGIHDMGPVKWDLVLCLLFAWIVMYVTATSPYIFMLVLLIRNSLLDGAKEGIIYYLQPDFSKMKDTQVWVDAGTQIFFSYSISLGALTALGSYNKFHHNSYRDAIIFACANSGTSIFAGFIIFSILGHMSVVQGKDIADVAEAGPGLAFIAYPKALTLLPGAPFWSIMFFLMVILLGLDSQFVGVEGVVTAVVDQFPGFLRKGHRREVFIGCVCILQFLVGLPMVCPGGMYVFQLFDYYSGSRIILFVAAFMCVAVAWCYGIRRFYDNLEMMYGWRINPYMAICWTVLSPIFCMRPKGVYEYPQWAVAIGWTMAAFAAVWIPIGWLYHIIRYGSSWELAFKPLGLRDYQLRSQDKGERSLADLNRPNGYISDGHGVPATKSESTPAYKTALDNKGGMDNPTFVPSEQPTFTRL